MKMLANWVGLCGLTHKSNYKNRLSVGELENSSHLITSLTDFFYSVSFLNVSITRCTFLVFIYLFIYFMHKHDSPRGLCYVDLAA